MKHTGREFKCSINQVIQLALLIFTIFFLLRFIPNRIWQDNTVQLAATLGIIGTWRYGWWLTHFIRAQIFGLFVYPRKKSLADKVWESGWRPKNLIFMMTTYKEDKSVTVRVLDSIFRESRCVDVPAKVFVGSGDIYDEKIIEEYIKVHGGGVDIEFIVIRQNKPGKRFAIGLALRAMSRYGVGGDDPVVFMDGDSIMAPGCLQKCLPFFELDKNLLALTTDEIVELSKGPSWIKSWLDLRFSQRHMAMQSHALSNKVLTLTGRMSVFRAENVVNYSFIRTVESDHLNHWLWDDFRFLSGDDKSTWYWLLKKGGNMFYVPDALVITVESIEGNGYERMVQNLLRWSGNVLRNGARALALGPRHVGLFTWWCILDQRIAMWTTLIGPMTAIIVAIFVSPVYILAYLVWVLTSRTVLSLMIFVYAGRIHVLFPFFLFANQLINSLVKVYIVFRLPKQRWMNRGNQKAPSASEGFILSFRNYMASYLTFFWVSLMAFSLLIYLEIFKPLPLSQVF
ncbi:glycosyltransferase family 2 protein [Aestuariicella hydrocarbonica]|uniref:Glycosyltransferase family 2 protein n=1 Tax=Pseudomaricurvus hydrocarbonicus TaxID=1470433 RepID=A0A9E5JNZ3_9GAMM|nr:glycosyltransferase [Aestuariicella hydrocarbonica]NHO63933.1 glycosyltransferase family 2 protein [Aestuariicella hydrocarbonica]